MADDSLQTLRRALQGGALDVTLRGVHRSPGRRQPLPERERIARNVALLEGLGHTPEESEHLRNLKAALAKMDAAAVACDHPAADVVALSSDLEWCRGCGALRRAPSVDWMTPERP